MRKYVKKGFYLLSGLGLLTTGYFLGQYQTKDVQAQVKPVSGTTSTVNPTTTETLPPSGRVIAYINENQPITREEFAEYLISRFGKERVRMYVNRRAIEMAAEKAGVTVTPEEVEARLREDCRRLGIDIKDLKAMLKERQNKTPEEWREETVRPALLLAKMSREEVRVEENELKEYFENQFGEKRQVKVIVWRKEDERIPYKIYERLRRDADFFDEQARANYLPDLAARGGLADPIGRYSGPESAKIEEIAFKLKEGEISEVIDTGNGVMVLKLVKIIPPRSDVTLDKVRAELTKDLADRKMERQIPLIAAQILTKAKPLFILEPADMREDEKAERAKVLNLKR
jgi:parvulin-like peptidyl-prolyl isomerase